MYFLPVLFITIMTGKRDVYNLIPLYDQQRNVLVTVGDDDKHLLSHRQSVQKFLSLIKYKRVQVQQLLSVFKFSVSSQISFLRER
jgi:hypothetical protein